MTPPAQHEELLRAPTAEELARLHSWTQVSLQRLVDAVLQPSTFLAAMIWLLGGSFMDVAVISMAAAMSYALGSIVMPLALSKVSDIRLVLLGASAVRAVASLIIAVVGWRAVSMSHDAVVLWVVIAVLFYQVSSAANVSRNPRSFIANNDQPTSARSRQVVGATAGLIGGLIAWRTLGNQRLDFDEAAGMLLFLAGMASLGSVWFQVTAPLRYQDTHQRLPVAAWSDVEHTLQNIEFRRFIAVRSLIGISTLADPFLIIFGMMQMQLSLRHIGAAVAMVVIAQIVGGGFWTLLGEMPGSRRSIQMAGLMRFGALTLALSVPFLADSRWYQSTFESRSFANWLFVAVFFVLALAQNSLTRNEQHYAMQRLGDGRLFPAADLVLNIVVVITSLTPLIGVLLIESYSLRFAVTVAASLAFVAFLATSLLASRKRRLRRRKLTPSPRKSVHPVSDRSPRSGSVKIKRVKK